MEKNGSAAPARKGGKTKQDGPAAGDQAQKDNQGASELQAGSTDAGNQVTLQVGSTSTGSEQLLQEGSTNAVDLQVPPADPVAGDQSGQIEGASTGASTASSLASFLIESTYGLEVTSSQAGFRRAGRAWSTTPTVVKLSELTEEQVLQIKNEPMLSARIVVIPDEEA